ncbi:MAG: glycoside hydrolase family 78 protein [Opitutales bacterium]|nr:glycoside hydrolase family 78 protein [Opitutales bacterium]
MKPLQYTSLLSLLIFTRLSAGFSVSNLEVETLTNPLGLDTSTPRFSWQLQSDRNGASQNAWQIQVLNDSKVLWTSPKTLSDQQLDVPYAGPSLERNTKYTWQITSWSDHGEKAENSGSFHIGLIGENPWQDAEWIGAAEDPLPSPYLRKEFSVGKKIKSAYLYVTGVGYFEAYLNGKKIGDEVLAPSPSQYQHRVYYSTFEVTDLLSKGENVIGMILGESQAAASGDFLEERFHNRARNYPGPLEHPMGIAKLLITYEDGQVVGINSDASWKQGRGGLRYNSFYGGEDFDARLEPLGWAEAGYDDSEWVQAVEYDFDAQLTSQNFEPIRVVDTLEPIKRIEVEPGVWLYDLGQLIGGWWKIDVSGKAGTTLKIQGAETLNESHYPKQLEKGDRISVGFAHGRGGHYERDAYTLYTLRGDSIESYEPRFFYSGFRYIQVSCDSPEDLKSLKIVGRTTHNDLPQSGSFECSNPVLTQLHINTAWTIKAIFQGGPMSNPNSEKYGWTGDAHLFAQPTNMIFDAQNFWNKWLRDIRDTQEYYETGHVVPTIPNFRRDITTTSPTWGTVYPLIVWYQYAYYGDTSVLKDHYQGLKDWVAYLQELHPTGLMQGVWADHVPPGVDEDGNYIQRGMSDESAELIASVYYCVSLQTLSKIAEILGNDDDQALYAKTAASFGKKINEKYFKKDLGYYVVPPAPKGFHTEQAANLIPLHYGIAPEEAVDGIFEYIRKDLAKHGNHLTTGIIGTKAMVDLFPANGMEELLYKVATQPDYPGWGFWIEKGATTHWQHWSGAPDHSHGMFGSISNFLVADIAGIRIPDPEFGTTAYKSIIFGPLVLDDLDYANASVPTRFGMVESSWVKKEDKLIVTLSLPTGTSGRFLIPEGYELSDSKEQSDKISLDSGVWDFELRKISN